MRKPETPEAPDATDPILDVALGLTPVPEHLEPKERARLEEARRALAVVDALPRVEPPPELRRRVFARIDRVDDRPARGWLSRLLAQPASRWGGGLALAGAAAAFLLAPAGERPAPPPPGALAQMERIEMAEDLELYENLEVVEHLDVLDDLELIASLPEESG